MISEKLMGRVVELDTAQMECDPNFMVIEVNEKFISLGIETKILAQIRNLIRQKAKIGKEKNTPTTTTANQSKNWKMLIKDFPAGRAQKTELFHKTNPKNFVCHKKYISLLGRYLNNSEDHCGTIVQQVSKSCETLIVCMKTTEKHNRVNL